MGSLDRALQARLRILTYPDFPAAFSPKMTVSFGFKVIVCPAASALTCSMSLRLTSRSGFQLPASFAGTTSGAIVTGVPGWSCFSIRNCSYNAVSSSSAKAVPVSRTRFATLRIQASCSLAHPTRRVAVVLGSASDWLAISVETPTGIAQEAL